MTYLRSRFLVTIVMLGALAACSPGATGLPDQKDLQPKVIAAASLTEAAEIASAGNADVKAELDGMVPHLSAQTEWAEEYRRTILLTRAMVLHEKYRSFPTSSEHFQAGYDLEQRGHTAEAHHHYLRAAEMTPEEPKYHAALGRTALQDRRPEEALAHYGRALELRPESAGWRVEYGLCLYELKRDDEALVEFERAREAMPDYGPVYERIAVVHWRKKDYEKARAYLEQCIAKGGKPRREFVELLSKEPSAAVGGEVVTPLSETP